MEFSIEFVKSKSKRSKIKRSDAVNLIILYNIIHLVFILYSIMSGYDGFIGLLYIFALYYGLWKMKRDWMYLLVFGMIVSTIYYIHLMLTFIDVFSMVFSVLNSISIYWLYSNRSLFTESEKGKSALGTKSEWIRGGLILLGIIVIPITIAMINFDYMIYGILSTPIWIIFVWFLLPRIHRRIKS